MNLSAANAYLRVTNQHKPVLLKAAGSNEQVCKWTHGLFGVFADALAGNKPSLEWLDRNVNLAASRESRELFLALCDMSVEARVYSQAAPEEPMTPVAETPAEIIPGVYTS